MRRYSGTRCPIYYITHPSGEHNKEVVDLSKGPGTDESITDKGVQEHGEQKDKNKDNIADPVLATSGHETARAEDTENREEPCPRDLLGQEEKIPRQRI